MNQTNQTFSYLKLAVAISLGIIVGSIGTDFSRAIVAGIQEAAKEHQAAMGKMNQEGKLEAIRRNLRVLEGAKDQWALEHKKGTGDLVNPTELLEYLKGNAMPHSIDGETYRLGAIGEDAIADYRGTIVRWQ